MDTKTGNVVCECDGDVENRKGKNTSLPVTVVLRVDMHCDGCIARIIRLARRLEGVETVRADPVSNKLTLIGFMDPMKITEKLHKKSKKKIELLSPKPKNETKVNNDLPKADNNTKTMVAVTTVTLKLNCSCDGCIKRIHKTVHKTKGVYEVTIDKEKEVVTVMGTMEVNYLTENLKRKLNKTVQVLPEKKNHKKKENTEGITKVGSPGLPGYGFTPEIGPYYFMKGPNTEFSSEEDQNFCCVM